MRWTLKPKPEPNKVKALQNALDIDANIATLLVQRGIETYDQAKARENFQQADADGNGKLTRAEFRNFINANADDGLGRAGMVRRFGAYDTAFDRVDKNKDGVVTPTELAAVRA